MGEGGACWIISLFSIDGLGLGLLLFWFLSLCVVSVINLEWLTSSVAELLMF